MERGLFLGLDLSTQSLTAVVISAAAGLVHQASINFDRAYPRYGTRGGVAPSADPLEARVNPMMWVERFGFHPGTRVVVGSGDNPCSLAGLGMIGSPKRHAVSLGTSDTYFGVLSDVPGAARTEGHIYGTASRAHDVPRVFQEREQFPRDLNGPSHQNGHEPPHRICLAPTLPPV